MGRFALALAAIILLILSAGLTRGQSQAASFNAGAPGAIALHENIDTFRAELLLVKRVTNRPTTPRAPNEEPPAPALLVYLALILVGSVGSVALARRQLHGES
jgi:hypothetical protein